MIIDQLKFVQMLNRLKNYTKLQDQIDDLFKDLVDNTEQDFCNAGGICIGHESVVIDLLETMFETDLISWWIYELDYGKDYKDGCLIENDRNIDVSTPEKLYEVLIKELENKK